MRTRSSLEYTIPRRRNRRRSRQQQEAIPLIPDPIPMADDRPMAEQLQAPTGGFESAIVVPPINAQNFELKSSLINLVQNRIFRGGNDEEPHAHIRHFESITNNQRYPDVPNTTIKLLLFPFSLDGVAKTWLDKEPPNSILTWDDLVSKFLQIFLRNQLGDVPVPMDHFLVPALTKKVLAFMVKKGKNFSGNVTPLFNSMLVQPTEDEGDVSERPSESQPLPSPTHLSEDQPKSQPDLFPRPSSSIPIPDSNLEGSGGNHRAQATEIKILKSRIKQLKKKARPVIDYHKAWFRAARLKKQQKKKDMKKSEKRRCVSKQGRKAVKSSKATLNDAMDYTLTQDEGKTEQQSTVKPDEGTDKQNEDTDRTKISTDSFVEEEEKKKLAEEETTKLALIRDYDVIQARIKADSILAARLQE
ncbi:hypothetical protein Tco_0031052 [Tanacetum coccineum]